MTAALRRLAGRIAPDGPVPVFPAVGAGGRARAEELLLHPSLRPVPSARHATVLLVAGEFPPRAAEPLCRVHDQMPHPRATAAWGAEGPGLEDLLPGADGADGADEVDEMDEVTPLAEGGDRDDPVSRLLATHRALMSGTRRSESHLLPDEPPNPWRGRGEHGQGGEGMMGGTPYGRPLANTRQDLRDGLALDRLELTAGPFLPGFPPGLVLRVALQGDVVQEAEVVGRPFAQPRPPIIGRALREPVRSRALEEARCRLILRRIARVLRVGGASALADRALRAATARRPDADTVRRLGRLVRSTSPLAGPAAREAGPAWTDVRGRLRRWTGAAERALAGRSPKTPGDGRTGPEERLRELGAPFRGDPEPEEALEALPGVLPGLEWGEMARLIASLDPVPVPEPKPEDGEEGAPRWTPRP